MSLIESLEHKGDAKNAIIKLIHHVECHYDAKVKTLYTDQGSEYLSDTVLGISHRMTTTHTPSHNGVPERFHLTVMNDVGAMLLEAKLPSEFWPEAALYACQLRNHVFVPKLKTSPAGIVGLAPIKDKNIHTFGQKCWVKVVPEGEKTATRSLAAIYLGPSKTVYGHLVFVPTVLNKLTHGYFIYARNVSFNNSVALFTTTSDGPSDLVERDFDLDFLSQPTPIDADRLENHIQLDGIDHTILTNNFEDDFSLYPM
ncbi:gag-pol fusion protein [Martiniozyma asiatica (nom. inval.)]|nr:gag-pol fusion protein [Martiniozyma asiatica]